MKKLSFTVLLFILSLAAFGQSDFNILYGPYLQNVSEHEATVIWVTNKKAVSWVEMAPDDETHFYAEERPQFFQTNFGKKMIGTLHSVRLTGLKTGTSYRYRIYSKEVQEIQPYHIQYGKVVASNVYSAKPFKFRTLDKDQSKASFLMVNDIHGDNTLFAHLLKDEPLKDFDFVLFNGDMLSDIRSEQQLFDGFMTLAVQQFATEIPMFFARGNHEARGLFSTEFINYFPTPTGQPYYSFRQGPAFFIVLDAGEDKPDSDIEYHGLGAFDIYRKEQTQWLKETLESEAFKQAPVKIVIMHVPPIRSTWYGPIQVKKEFIPLLNNAGIDLMLSGHLHQHFYIPAGEDDLQFPLLINSNKHAVRVDVNGKQITLQVKDEAGKLFKEIKLQ
ncbi:metallophosphoesterase family protein [Parabacteroides sp. PF5-9]|uniref:metallophosphoesterase family protein n=1 Tax=Parabacteroides sp. PF5-9 TaxID=1742404 RepID=UPI0024766EDC|nr:metallophosphoesterase family protein [Parabacteroides sp. PF5-9]MDH6357640.1 putative phosphodiesterase [Parabacteroides sp. PF5-9]